MSEEIRIYIADLAAYNHGLLHGKWVDATQDVADIHAEIKTMLAASPVEHAEEYAIHDYEGFEGYQLHEYEGIDTANQIACFIEAHGKLGAELLDYYDLDEAEKAISENYCGCFNSVADYAQTVTEDTSTIPSHLEYYIDYDKMGRDMQLSGDVFTIETAHDECHVFMNC